MNGIGKNFLTQKNNTIKSTMKNNSLPVLCRAVSYQTKTTKSPHFCGLNGVFVLSGTGRCQTLNHSHSIVAGGFPEMS